MKENATSGLQTTLIDRFDRDCRRAEQDVLAVEEPLQIRLSAGGAPRSLAITMRTPGADAELALGFLFTEGIISDPAQVRAVDLGERNARNTITVTLAGGCSIDWAKLQRHNYTSSSCGVCGKTSLEQVEQVLPFGELPDRLRVSADTIASLPNRLRTKQPIFAETGGIHAAGLFTGTGELLDLAEDVGRHNALDKVIGRSFRTSSLPLGECILVLSGRAGFELIQKAGMAGIPIIVAVGAPSSLAVSLADELSMTLCGFARREAFNCYSHPHRIVK